MARPQPYPDENSWWNSFREQVLALYAEAGRVLPPDWDLDAFKWFSRTGHTIGTGMMPAVAATKHIMELEQALAIPAIGLLDDLHHPPGYPSESGDDAWWPKFIAHVQTAYRSAGRPLPADQDMLMFMWWARTGHSIGQGMDATTASRRHLRELRDALGLTAPVNPTPGSAAKLVGQLMVMGRSYADATGPRKVQFCSFFPSLYIRKHDKDRYLRTLDLIASRWQGFRTFRAVGAEPFWSGRRVLPDWGDYAEQVIGELEDCRARGLKIHSTAGDMQVLFPGGHGEIEFTKRYADLVQQSNHADTVALFEVWNEGWQNNAYREDSGRASAIARAFRERCPGPLVALSAPQSGEEPAGLRDMSRYPAHVAALHGARNWGMGIGRIFGSLYGDGHIDWLGKPIWQGEPTGPGEPVWSPQDNPAWLFGLYAMHQLCGQASVYFNGPGIRYEDGRNLDDTWGFHELPGLLSVIPEDIGQFAHVTHGNLGRYELSRQTSPLTSHKWHDRHNTGQERIDQFIDGDGRFLALVYLGSGWWPLHAIKGMDCEVYTHQGLVDSFGVDAHTDLPAAAWMHSDTVAALLVGKLR